MTAEQHQGLATWPEYLKFCAGQARGGTVWQGDGVGGAWANSLLPVTNGIYLTAPVDDRNDLERRIVMAKEFAAGSSNPWFLYLANDYFPEPLLAECEHHLARYDLVPAMRLTGMVADALAPPRRPPAEGEIRRIEGGFGVMEACDLQSFAYGIPPELCRSAGESGAFFSDPAREFGSLLLAQGTPVSTTTTVRLANCLYVALVATHPEHQRKGYAETVFRHSVNSAIAACGASPVVLHATEAGYPVYAAMGFRPTVTFVAYSLPH